MNTSVERTARPRHARPASPTWTPSACCRAAAELAAVLRSHPQVESVLCGHLHRSIQARFGSTLASSCPSPAHQVALDLREAGPDCFVMEPPGYQLHAWRGGRLVTHTVVLGDWPGPYRFREGGVLID